MSKALGTIRIRAAGILIRDGKILLVRHEKEGRSYWLLPGGGVEFGETIGEGLAREFREEVGLEIKVGKLVLVQDSIPPDRHRQVLNLTFLVSAREIDLKVTPDGVLRDAAFHSFEEFKGMQVNPNVKAEILEGVSNGWTGEVQYLGNRWD